MESIGLFDKVKKVFPDYDESKKSLWKRLGKVNESQLKELMEFRYKGETDLKKKYEKANAWHDNLSTMFIGEGEYAFQDYDYLGHEFPSNVLNEIENYVAGNVYLLSLRADLEIKRINEEKEDKKFSKLKI
jgi:hypothetical protein